MPGELARDEVPGFRATLRVPVRVLCFKLDLRKCVHDMYGTALHVGTGAQPRVEHLQVHGVGEAAYATLDTTHCIIKNLHAKP